METVWVPLQRVATVNLFGSPYMRGMEKRVWVAHGKWTEAGDDQVSITTRAEGKEGGKEGRGRSCAYKQAIIR